MALLADVNSNVPWPALAKVLNLPVASPALPSRTDCPFCLKHRMYVFKDTITNGHWHYCYDCGHSGDLVSLAADVWGMSLAGALQKLRLEGFNCPEMTAELLERYHAERRHRLGRWNDLWSKSREQLATYKSSGLSALRERYRLLGNYSSDRWLAGPGMFVGGASVKQVEKALLSPSMISDSDDRDRKRLMFPGKRWRDVLVIPFYGAPKRISGMWFMGRNGGKDSRVFRSGGVTRGTKRIEAGLAGLSSVGDAQGQFGPYVFAVEDPLLMLRLQVRHMQTSTLPLPIVAYHADKQHRTQHAWSSLLHNKVIFWTWHITPEIVWQAMQADGDIALMPLTEPTRKSVNHLLRLASPRDVLRRSLKYAKPWRTAVADWVITSQPGVLEELLIGLSSHEIDVDRFTKEIGLLVDVPHVMPRLRHVMIGDYVVVEREDGWYHYKAPNANRMSAVIRLLCDAKVVVKRIVMGEVPRYEGYIEFRDQNIPYSIPVSQANYRAKNWLTLACLRAGVGCPTISQSKIGLFDVALALSTPEEVMAGSQEPGSAPGV